MDMQPDSGAAVPAESPTAPDFSAFEQEQNTADLARFRPASPAADRADQAPDPVSESAAPPADDPSPDPKPKKNLDTRIAQLKGENDELSQQLRTRRMLREELSKLNAPPAKNDPPASKPASQTQAQDWQRYKGHPDAPQVESFESYEDYLDARAVFLADRRFEDRERTSRLDAESKQRAQSLQDRITGFHDRLKSARDSDPDFEATLNPSLLEVEPAFALPHGTPIRAHNVLAQHLVWSEASTALLKHFSTPEGQQDWARLCQTETPADLMLGFGRLEARFLGDVPAKAAPAPAKPVSTAPPPPTTVGSRASGPVDRKDHAVRNRDYSAYEAAANAEDLAVRRR